MSKNTQLGNLVNGIFVDSTGKVGVGNVSPTVALDVTGAGLFSSTITAATGINIGLTGTNYINWITQGGIKLGRTNIGPEDSLTSRWTGTLAYIDIAGSAQWNGGVTILPNGGGNVGIGTGSPNRSLVVSGGNLEQLVLISSNTTCGISFNASNTTYSTYVGTTGNDIVFQTLGNERMRITSAGNIGLGTGSPLYKTHIVNGGASAFFGISNQGVGNGDRQLRLGFGGTNSYAEIQGTRANIADDVFIAMQAGGGKVGIGTTSIKSLLGSNTKLTVAGSGGSGSGAAGASMGSASGSGTGALNLGISVDALDGGMTLILLASRNVGAGTNTASAVYILSFYYSDGNFPAITYLGGTSNFVSFGSSGGNITVTNAAGGNNLYSWFANK